MEELYNHLKGKFPLPDYHEINHLFEISDIEETEFLIRCIRMKIMDKICSMLKILDDLVQPEGSFANLHELQFIDDGVKKTLFSLYKELNYLDRLSSELSINEDDMDNCDFINDVMKRWDGISSRMLKILNVVKESWKHDFESEEKLRYMG